MEARCDCLSSLFLFPDLCDIFAPILKLLVFMGQLQGNGFDGGNGFVLKQSAQWEMWLGPPFRGD
ncbi:MAG: hypothetical protein WCR74_21255 [Betaproteobacteria bacterium]